MRVLKIVISVFINDTLEQSHTLLPLIRSSLYPEFLERYWRILWISILMNLLTFLNVIYLFAFKILKVYSIALGFTMFYAVKRYFLTVIYCKQNHGFAKLHNGKQW